MCFRSIEAVARSAVSKANIGGSIQGAALPCRRCGASQPATGRRRRAAAGTRRSATRDRLAPRLPSEQGLLLLRQDPGHRLDSDDLLRRVLVTSTSYQFPRPRWHPPLPFPESTRPNTASTVVAGFVIQKSLSNRLIEELRALSMSLVRAHGQGAALVLEAVVGFVLDRRVPLLVRHVPHESAALNHEVSYHTMKISPSKNPSSTYLRKFATDDGPCLSSS